MLITNNLCFIDVALSLWIRISIIPARIGDCNSLIEVWFWRLCLYSVLPSPPLPFLPFLPLGLRCKVDNPTIAQKRWPVLMVLVCGDILGVVGWVFLNYFCMMWGMVLEWSFGSMCGVEIVLSKRLFRNFIVLVEQRILQKHRLCVGLVGGFIGMLNFVILHKIGNKNPLICLWIWSTLRRYRDWVCWKPTRSRGFEVRGFYLSFYPPTILSFPWKMIWKSKVPPRVAFFSWSASLGKILTTNNLRKRGVLVLDWCYMCKNCGELVDHLLLHCPIACELWSLVFCLFGIH